MSILSEHNLTEASTIARHMLQPIQHNTNYNQRELQYRHPHHQQQQQQQQQQQLQHHHHHHHHHHPRDYDYHQQYQQLQQPEHLRQGEQQHHEAYYQQQQYPVLNNAGIENVIDNDYFNLSTVNDIYNSYNSSTNAPNTSSGSMSIGLGNNNNLTATIASIRTNVTRVLYMYFQNVTDEFGYGAATTTTTTSIPTAIPATESNTTTALIEADGGVEHSASTTTTSLVATLSTLSKHLRNATTSSVITPTAAAAAAETIATATTAAAVTSTEMATAASTSSTLLASVASVATPLNITTTAAASAAATTTIGLSTAPSITYPSYRLAIRSYENCSALFANYTQPQQGLFCNWTWDRFLCWPPTPAGVLARMHCPTGWHGVDTRKFANRKCELNGRWGGRPNDTNNPIGWTDYQPCYKPEVNELMQRMPNLDLLIEIAKRTRTLEIVGLILSLCALILSLIIFCHFRSLRNNRTKIHKNLFVAMVLQVVVRLTLYLDQAFRRDRPEMARNASTPGIENTPYLCEASYVLLEYARTAMFMWMFIEGLYLHNMVTVAVFQGRFPHTIFSLIGWGMPVVMTAIWATCTAIYTDGEYDCWWNYNLTPYYWILEGPRLVVILLNFFFLMNIIRVLVMKLRQSQASDIEQTRKAVRAAIVLLPLLGITNLLHLVPDVQTPWKFALWSYVTHFLTSFQGFFIALIYCFLNGEVRAVLLKSLTVYMSVRGHPEWAPKRASMFSGAYNTAPETEGQLQQDSRRHESPPKSKRLNGSAVGGGGGGGGCGTGGVNSRRYSDQEMAHTQLLANPRSTRITTVRPQQQQQQQQQQLITTNNEQHHQLNNHNYNNNNNNNNINSFYNNVNNNNNNNNNCNNNQHHHHHQQLHHNNINSHNSNRSRSNNNRNYINTNNPADHINHSNASNNINNNNNNNWMLHWTLCFRGQKVLRVPTSASSVPPESVVFELSEQ